MLSSHSSGNRSTLCLVFARVSLRTVASELKRWWFAFVLFKQFDEPVRLAPISRDNLPHLPSAVGAIIELSFGREMNDSVH